MKITFILFSGETSREFVLLRRLEKADSEADNEGGRAAKDLRRKENHGDKRWKEIVKLVNIQVLGWISHLGVKINFVNWECNVNMSPKSVSL